MNRTFGHSVLTRLTTITQLKRDLLFAVMAVTVAGTAIIPGASGAGTSIPYMQMIGVMAAMTVAAAGLNLVSGFTGLISLGQGAMYAIGAYGFAYLLQERHLSILVAAPTTLAICAALGMVIALATARLRGPEFTMVTLVLAVLVHQVLAVWSPLGASSGYPNPLQHGAGLLPDASIFGVRFVAPLFAGEFASVVALVLGVTVVVLVGYRNLSQSSWGQSLSALGASDMLASHLGVRVFHRKAAALGLSGALGGLGGIFYALTFGHLQPESFDVFLSITILLGVILGGSGTILGPVVGAVVVTWLEQSNTLEGVTRFQQRYFSDTWYLSTPGIVGVILILVLFLMPRGLVGSLGDAVAKRARGDASQASFPDADLSGNTLAELLSVADTSGETDDYVLKVSHATKSFGGLRAVDDVSLGVKRGTVHGLIGPNGAGKSSLANLMSGAYKPDSGSILVEGEEVSGERPDQIHRRGLVRTFQTPQLFSAATVLDNVKAGFVDIGRLPWWKAALKPPSQYRRGAELDGLAESLLRRVGLLEEAHLTAGSLAYGKARALEIARALASRPRVIVLDEPAAGLNSTEVMVLGRLIAELRSDGIAVVLVEHHMDLILSTADVVTCMSQGRVIAHGSAEEVLLDEAVMAVYLGSVRPDERALADSSVQELNR